jgi:hypothetical protein
MYGLTRATTTLIAAGVAGLLIWLATQISNDHTGGYWARVGLVAAAGLVMALSQLLGGWTKWGMPRLSIPVLLTAFVPVAIVSLWVILAGQPTGSWFHDHVMSWTRDLHISGLVTDMLYYIPVLAFGTGLVFGYSFDTTGPRVRDREVVDGRRGVTRRRGRRGATADDTAYDRDADAPLTADRTADTPTRDRETEPTRRGLFGRRRTTSDDTAYDRDADAPPSADGRSDGQPSDREPVASQTTTRSPRTSDDT